MSDTEKRTAEIELRELLMGNISHDTYKWNYLLEAGAGAGKTHTMVNRIMNQLVYGLIRPENLVAITFTEKATQEMVDRIDSEIRKRLKKSVEVHGVDSAEAAHIRALIGELDRMQISTIHGFCSKLLKTMPFESGLGPDFDIEEDIEAFAKHFFDLKVQENEHRFESAMEMTGLGLELFEASFLKICESGDLVCRECGGNVVADIERRQRACADEIGAILREKGDVARYKPGKNDDAIHVTERITELLRLAHMDENAFADVLLNMLGSNTGYYKFEDKDIERLLPRTSSKETAKNCAKAAFEQIKSLQKEKVFLCCAPILRELQEEYRKYKLEQRIASQNDLLIFARNMLRDSTEARVYFHDRYRTVYVDEMQDTDPIQAQILFYLTTDEAAFDRDWQKCMPVPGSLFMVGDPKQAIYRFRGADITVYKKLVQLFKEKGIGETPRLSFNYRSAAEITGCVDHNFDPEGTGSEQYYPPCPMIADDYQAAYSSMIAYHGTSRYARVITYLCEPEDDADRVAAFISEMIVNKVMIGLEGEGVKEEDKPHPARNSDFMILTRNKKQTERYVRELANYGIPCNMSGAMKYADSARIASAMRVLRYLADEEDDVALVAVLTRCYGIPLSVLRSYRQRVGSLFGDHLSVKKAFLEEGTVPEEYDSIFSALAELEKLRAGIGSSSAMAVIEELFFKSAAVWGGQQPPETRDYALLTLFLNQLREDGDAGFTELVARASVLSEGQSERELQLDEKADCVRVMNLHKAKGLEAQIVILANGSKSRNYPVTEYIEYENGDPKVHMSLVASNGYTNYVVGRPDNWDYCDWMENAFIGAEELRLLYVAVTRAKSCLVINTDRSGFWSKLQGRTGYNGEGLDFGEGWDKAIRALSTGESDYVQPVQGAIPVLRIVTNTGIDGELADRAADAAVRGTLYMTPSMLDTDMKKPFNTDGDEEAAEIPVSMLSEPPSKPCGTDWGTLVHRVMELAVKNAAFTQGEIKEIACRAVRETVGDIDLLSADRTDMLFAGCESDEPDEMRSYLEEAAAKAAGFLTNSAHPIRMLINGAKCYTELPFILRESDMDSELVQAVRIGFEQNSSRLIERNGMMQGAKDIRPIDINGVIDLAVRRGDEWIIVDYKTDSIRSFEDEAAYAARLKQCYTAQLSAYRSVLNKLSMGTVKDVYICAVNLNGRLIGIS